MGLPLPSTEYKKMTDMNHAHHQHNRTASARLNRIFIFSIALNLAFVLIEAGSGFYFDSLALLSDAGHNLSDVVSLILAMLAFRLARIKPSANYTYGYKKSTVLVSLLNAIILLVAVGIIIAESIEKLRDPQPLNGSAIAWVAGIGIIINALTTLLFFKDKSKDLNIKGAYLHMAADTLVSAGVLVSGIIIRYTGWNIIDPIIGLIVAIVILISTWNLLHDSLRLSLDGVPRNIDPQNVIETITAATGVKSVHHLHIWAISTTQTALTAHLVIEQNADEENVKKEVKTSLKELGIQHATLELEAGHACCTEAEGCDCSSDEELQMPHHHHHHHH